MKNIFLFRKTNFTEEEVNSFNKSECKKWCSFCVNADAYRFFDENLFYVRKF